MLLSFFKFGNELHYDGSDYMSWKQFLVTGILLVIIIALAILLRKVDHKKIKIYLIVMSILMPITEAIKIHYCAVIEHAVGNPFSYAGDLPLYTCSIFMIALPLAAFFKGRYKDVGLSFLTTIGIAAGFSNFVCLNILKGWPIVHYLSFNSIFFHAMMIFTGLWLLTSGYVELKPINIHNAMLLIFIFSAFAIPVTYEQFYKFSDWCDYMLYCRGADLPILGDLATKARDNNMMALFTIGMMTIGYSAISALIFGISKLIQFLAKLIINKFDKSKEQVTTKE